MDARPAFNVRDTFVQWSEDRPFQLVAADNLVLGSFSPEHTKPATAIAINKRGPIYRIGYKK
jgi:hypothetical protein